LGSFTISFGAEPPSDYAQRARQARFLQYRGFSSAQIKAALEFDPDSD
jgi:SOS response regulatory protein OraA/RecX